MDLEENEELEEETEEKKEQSGIKELYENNKKLIWSAGIIIILIIIFSLFGSKKDNSEIKILYNGSVVKEISVEEMNTLQLNADSNNTLNWKSNNSDIAMVIDGLVKGINKGQTTIEVVEANTNRKGSCKVTVLENKNGISFPDGALIISTGDSYNLVSTLNNNYDLYSSNTSVLTIDNNGKVRALKSGVSKISLMKDNSIVIDEIMVHVVNKKINAQVVSSVNKINIYSNQESILKGQTKKLNFDIIPSMANNLTILWESSNKSIANVDEDGNITGYDIGTCVIKARTLEGNEIASIVVIVEDELTINVPTSTNVYVNNKVNINVSITPSNAKRDLLTFISANPSIAKVYSNDGGKTITIKGISTGITNVIINNNNNEKARIDVHVIALQGNGGGNGNGNLENRGYTPQSSDAYNNKYLFNNHDETTKKKATGPVTIIFKERDNMGTTSVRVCRYRYGSTPCNLDKNYQEVKLGEEYKIQEKGDWVLRIREYKNDVARREADEWYINISEIFEEKVTGCYASVSASSVGNIRWLDNQSPLSFDKKTVILYKDDCEEAHNGNLCFRQADGSYAWGSRYAIGEKNSYVKGIKTETTCLSNNYYCYCDMKNEYCKWNIGPTVVYSNINKQLTSENMCRGTKQK